MYFVSGFNSTGWESTLSEKSGLLRGHSFEMLRRISACGIHNFAEGLATFTAAMNGTNLVIAIYNIPEGIAVSVAVYYATGNKKKAFTLSFLSGLSEPIGAIIGYVLLMQFMSPLVFGIVFAAVAGIMVFISIDELLPAAREYGEHHLSIYGLIAGMGVMAFSLLMFI
jgi:ZIP family zinc transporter